MRATCRRAGDTGGSARARVECPLSKRWSRNERLINVANDPGHEIEAGQGPQRGETVPGGDARHEIERLSPWQRVHGHQIEVRAGSKTQKTAPQGPYEVQRA